MNKVTKFALAAALLVVVYLLLVVGSKLWERAKTADVWALIPDNAVMVFETPHTVELWHEIDTMSVWNNLKTIPYFQALNKRGGLIDSLGRRGIDIEKYLQGKSVVTSLHATSKEDFDYLFFIPVPLEENLVIKRAIAELTKDGGYRMETREYQGLSIQELADRQTEDVFSYIIYKNYFIGSFTPFLVEDAIRNISQSNREDFYSLNKEAFKFERIDRNNDGNVFLNMKKLPELLSVFANDSTRQELKGLATLSGAMATDMRITDHQLQFNGQLAVNDDKDEADFLSVFDGQNPTAITNLVQFIPRRTSVFYRLGFDNNSRMYSKLRDHWLLHNEALFKAEEEMINEYNFDSKDFYEEIREEVALAILESLDPSQTDRLVFVRAQKPVKMNDIIYQLAENARVEKEDSLFFENYGQLKITRINVNELPRKLFGDMFAGFSTSYFTFLNDYLIIGNSTKAIKDLIEAVDNEQVWGKQHKSQKFLNLADNKSNVSMIVNMSRSWNRMAAGLSPKWRPLFDRYKRQILRFEFMACQVSVKEENYYAQLSLMHQQIKRNEQPFETLFTASTDNALATKPFIVKSHLDKSREVLVQDRPGVLYLISKQGQRLWALPIGAPILDQVYQVDIYNNEKLQYLFATRNRVYLVDRLGRVVPNFPISYAWEAPIAHVSVIDYDNTKNYRIAVADQAGNLYLFSKEGMVLEGWRPRRFAAQLAAPLGHIRAGGRDCLLALHREGMVNVVRRNAEVYPGFPINFNAAIRGQAYIHYGTDLENTTINILTGGGELIKLNLSGAIIGREQLERSANGSSFRMCIDEVEGEDWIAVRQEDKYVSLFAEDGRLLFEEIYTNPSQKDVQYFNFGANVEIVAVTDRQERKTHLYYINGDRVSKEALDSDHEIAMVYSDAADEFYVYKTFGREMNMVKFTRD